MIHELRNTIDVWTPLGYGKAIAWIDYGSEVNTVWKVVLYDGGKVRNFFDEHTPYTTFDGNTLASTPRVAHQGFGSVIKFSDFEVRRQPFIQH